MKTPNFVARLCTCFTNIKPEVHEKELIGNEGSDQGSIVNAKASSVLTFTRRNGIVGSMARAILLMIILCLLGCSQKKVSDQPPDKPDSNNYMPCAVLQDYLVEQRITLERPETYVSEHDLKMFHYVDPKPIWNKQRQTKGPASAKTASEALEAHKAFILSRIDATILEDTYLAYTDAQADGFEPSKCVFPAYIYTKNDGLKIVETRAEHNKQLRLKSMKDQRQYKKKVFNSKAARDPEISKAIRKEAYENQLPYMLRKFSRIGINPKDNQAFFYAEYYCGMLCAEGYYVLMQLEDGIWEVTARVRLWVS